MAMAAGAPVVGAVREFEVCTPRGMARLVMLHSLFRFVPLTCHLFPPLTLVSAQY